MHFLVRITIQNTNIFFIGQPWWLTLFQGIFATGHGIFNLNPEIGHGYEIIIAFGGLHGPKHRYWCVMTTRSCNFDKSQYRQLRMGYDYEIGQQVYLLEKNPFGTSCQLLVT